MEISSAYRSSRRNTSILCGVGIAWAAGQFEINEVLSGKLAAINETASIPILISILCLYTISRCTIEFMMQPNEVRRWSLAKLDYQITLYLVRFTIFVLPIASVARTEKMVIYLAGLVLFLALGFFLLSFILLFFFMPLRIFIRKLMGRISIASAAIEATFYSFLFSGVTLVAIIISVGLNLINPLHFIGPEYQAISDTHLITFSCVWLVILLSIFFDGKFLKMVFSDIPSMKESMHIDNDGKKTFTLEPNPEHPDFENRQKESKLIYTKAL